MVKDNEYWNLECPSNLKQNGWSHIITGITTNRYCLSSETKRKCQGNEITYKCISGLAFIEELKQQLIRNVTYYEYKPQRFIKILIKLYGRETLLLVMCSNWFSCKTSKKNIMNNWQINWIKLEIIKRLS